MPRKASTNGASVPSKSKAARSRTAKVKSKDKAAPREEARKASSQAASKPSATLPLKEGARDTAARAPYRPMTGRTLDSPIETTDAPVDDTESSEAKAAPVSSRAQDLTLDEAPGSPTSEPSNAKGFRYLFDSSDEDEEEGAVSEPQEISNDLDEQQERYHAAQLQ
ncbi:Hypothetical protein PHPALM_5534, partial [Phytophthora palmivora]